MLYAVPTTSNARRHLAQGILAADAELTQYQGGVFDTWGERRGLSMTRKQASGLKAGSPRADGNVHGGNSAWPYAPATARF